jgi:hypothetical protein
MRNAHQKSNATKNLTPPKMVPPAPSALRSRTSRAELETIITAILSMNKTFSSFKASLAVK